MRRNQENQDEKQSEGKIIKDIRNAFKLKEENETIKDNIRNLFELDEGYYKSVRAGNFANNNSYQYEINVDRKKSYQSKQPNNTLIKLDHT